MTSHSTSSESPSKKADEYPHVHVSSTWRVVVHVWVIIHLLAVIAPPLAFATMGAPLPQWLYNVTRPYVDTLFLDHGYAFFAPEVGPNHLVEYRVWQANDQEPQVGRFPNLQEQWPRLVYHRHFMLSETLNNRFEPPNLPREYFGDDRSFAAYQQRRSMYEQLKQSFAGHLKHHRQAERVELARIEHRQPNPAEFEDGMLLHHADLYRTLPETAPPQQEIWPGGEPMAPPPLLRRSGPLPYGPGPFRPQPTQPEPLDTDSIDTERDSP